MRKAIVIYRVVTKLSGVIVDEGNWFVEPNLAQQEANMKAIVGDEDKDFSFVIEADGLALPDDDKLNKRLEELGIKLADTEETEVSKEFGGDDEIQSL